MSAAERARQRAELAHARATAPNAWRCRRPGCPIVDVWHPEETRAAAEAASAEHQRRAHPPEPLDNARPRA